jgi:hypothetical protein
MIDNSQGWSVARIVSSVTPRASSKPTLIASLWPACSLARRKRAWRILRGSFDLEPVRRIMPRDVGVEFGLRPFGERGAEFPLRHFDALRAVHFREAAGEHRFGFVIQRAQQLRLPAVPHTRTDAADVGGGQNRQELHLLDRLHHAAKFSMVLRSTVARLRHRRHRQMLFDQPRYRFGVGSVEAEAAGTAARHFGARDRMILGPALGDVVQQRRDIDHRAMLGANFAHQIAGDDNSSMPPRSMSCR